MEGFHGKGKCPQHWKFVGMTVEREECLIRSKFYLTRAHTYQLVV